MSKATTCKPSVRLLKDWEIEEARCVFGEGLNYTAVRIHECTTWTNSIDKIGRRLKGMPLAEVNNALTLGNHCFFPVRLLDQLVPIDHGEYYKVGWLIHELTHAWQYQRLGWRYIWLALSAQFRGKGAAYDFGHEEGLKKRRREGWTLQKFNLEQQGDIARLYHTRLRRGEDVSEWLPYIEDIQKTV